ncbi:MAG: MmgE/PrpD family protein [Deltaproteobacteria bacterium]|nr:MmgE/PrpD family protein [Deltaproteobacteria bacterium]
MNESQTLAKYIVDTDYNDLPTDVVDITKKSFLDGLGVMLGASGLGEGCQQFVSIAAAMGGKTESTILGTNTKVPSYMAAFANGSMSHALDFEDLGAGIHPNASAIPAALAIAEAKGDVNGKDLVTALALGCDIVCRLSLARSREEDPLTAGWYIPPILSAYGATTAVSKLLGLSPEEIVDAFSLTLCQATCSAELIHSPKSLIRSVRDAFAAKAGVLSALLAQKGIKGFDHPIEGKAGFFALYSNNKYNPDILTHKLGEEFESRNIRFKPWPSCGGTHPYAEEALQIANQYNINPNDIEEIRLLVGTKPIHTMLYEPIDRKKNPKTAIDAKFSIPFVVAAALKDKSVKLDHFLPQALEDQMILNLTQKITYEIQPQFDYHMLETQGLVHVKTKQEEIQSTRVEFLYGHSNNPMSNEALVEKFIDCATHSTGRISENYLKKAAQMILSLENLDNVREVVECLAETHP